MKNDAEPSPQRSGDQSRPRRRSDKRELRQLKLYRTRSRTLTDHDVDVVILHRRVEDLFDRRIETVDLVYEKHVAFFEIGQDRRKVAGLFYDRARR